MTLGLHTYLSLLIGRGGGVYGSVSELRSHLEESITIIRYLNKIEIQLAFFQ
jgi:hypothetical protein